ncbi:MAG: HIT family protein [Actinomycetota bacterium]
MSDCAFCRIGSREAAADRILEDERTFAFLDIHPAGEGHTLVIPKAHVVNIWDVSAEDWDAVWRSARRAAAALRASLDPDGITVRQANGPIGGQEVMHLHVHLIPRYVRGRAPRLASLAEIAERIRTAL